MGQDRRESSPGVSNLCAALGGLSRSSTLSPHLSSIVRPLDGGEMIVGQSGEDAMSSIKTV